MTSNGADQWLMRGFVVALEFAWGSLILQQMPFGRWKDKALTVVAGEDLVLLFAFETESHSVAPAGLKLYLWNAGIKDGRR